MEMDFETLNKGGRKMKKILAVAGLFLLFAMTAMAEELAVGTTRIKFHDEIGSLKSRGGDRVPAGAICTQQLWTVNTEIATVLLGSFCIAGVPDGDGKAHAAFGIGIAKIPAIGLGIGVFYDDVTKQPYLGIAGSVSNLVNAISNLRLPKPQ